MGKQFTNFVEGTLNASVLTAATSIAVNFVTNGAVPTGLSVADYMLFVIDPEGAEHPPEVVKATAISGGSNPYTLTVTRAQESTTAQDWDSGRKIVAGVTAAQLDDLTNETPSQLLTSIKTVDGSGSGLDADTVDGNEASAFATSGHTHAAFGALTLSGDVAWSTGSARDVGTYATPTQAVYADDLRLVGGNVIVDAPDTNTGDSAEWQSWLGTYILVRNSSLTAEKENISTDLEGWLTASMVDDLDVKIFNRITAPNFPEIGFMAEDLDAVSPFLASHGTDASDDKILTGVNRTGVISLLVLALQDARARIAALEV